MSFSVTDRSLVTQIVSLDNTINFQNNQAESYFTTFFFNTTVKTNLSFIFYSLSFIYPVGKIPPVDVPLVSKMLEAPAELT